MIPTCRQNQPEGARHPARDGRSPLDAPAVSSPGATSDARREARVIGFAPDMGGRVSSLHAPKPRYLAAALALKGFGLSRATRRAYRAIGDHLSRESHSRVSPGKLAAGAQLWELASLCESADAESARYLEVGTGWTLFYGLLFRLHFDGRLSLFDVQDCRQVDALRERFARVGNLLPDGLPEEFLGNLEQYRQRAALVASAVSLEGLNDRLNLEYVVEPNGSLRMFADDTFDVVFSWNVLEHVPRCQFLSMTRDHFRVLRPNGIAIHHIDFTDHLTTQYAPSASRKEYLRYGECAWRVLFDNRMQHMNRLQPSHVASAFLRAGFEAVHDRREIDRTVVPWSDLADQWNHLATDDVACTAATLVFRKPRW